LKSLRIIIKLANKQFYVKFINISQSFGIKIEINNSKSQSQHYKKPINIFSANFNKIVKAGIKIKSFIFSFNIPNEDLNFTKSKLHEIDYNEYGYNNEIYGHTNSIGLEIKDEIDSSVSAPALNYSHSMQDQKEESHIIKDNEINGHRKTLSTKSKSNQTSSFNQQRLSKVSLPSFINAHVQNMISHIRLLTPFEIFLKNTTPFITQLLENDTLKEIFN